MNADVSRLAFGPAVGDSERAVDVADDVLHVAAVARIHREIAEHFAVENRLVARRYRRIRLPEQIRREAEILLIAPPARAPTARARCPRRLSVMVKFAARLTSVTFKRSPTGAPPAGSKTSRIVPVFNAGSGCETDVVGVDDAAEVVRGTSPAGSSCTETRRRLPQSPVSSACTAEKRRAFRNRCSGRMRAG